MKYGKKLEIVGISAEPLDILVLISSNKKFNSENSREDPRGST